MSIKTHAPKLNAEIHIVKAHVKRLTLNINASEESNNDCMSRTSTVSTPAGCSPEKAQITWEVVTWGKLPKTDHRLTGEFGHTPIDISVRNIEYA